LDLRAAATECCAVGLHAAAGAGATGHPPGSVTPGSPRSLAYAGRLLQPPPAYAPAAPRRAPAGRSTPARQLRRDRAAALRRARTPRHHRPFPPASVHPRRTTTHDYRIDAGDNLALVSMARTASQFLSFGAAAPSHAADRAVPRAAHPPPNWQAASANACASAISARPTSPPKSKPTDVSSSRRGGRPGHYPYVPNMTAESRWRSPSAYRRAPYATASPSPHLQRRTVRAVVPPATPNQSGRHIVVGDAGSEFHRKRKRGTTASSRPDSSRLSQPVRRHGGMR